VPATALPEGINTVAISASDNAGNAAWCNWSFCVATPAAVISTGFSNGSQLPSGQFTFNASFSGDVGPLPGSVTLLIDGVDATSNATVTPSGIIYAGELLPGNHTLRLQVTNSAGNTTFQDFTFSINAPSGNGTPGVTTVVIIVVAVAALGSVAVYLFIRKGK